MQTMPALLAFVVSPVMLPDWKFGAFKFLRLCCACWLASCAELFWLFIVIAAAGLLMLLLMACCCDIIGGLPPVMYFWIPDNF